MESHNQTYFDEKTQRRLQFANMYDVPPILPTYAETAPMIESHTGIDSDDCMLPMLPSSRKRYVPRYLNIKKTACKIAILVMVVLQMITILLIYEQREQLKMLEHQEKTADSIQKALTYVKNENKQNRNLMIQNQKALADMKNENRQNMKALADMKDEKRKNLDIMKQKQMTQRNNVTSLILQKLFQLESNMKIIINKNKKDDVTTEKP